MLQYKLNNYFHVSDYDSDYLKHYLEAIGIHQVNSFLDKPTDTDELDPFLLTNMTEGIRMLYGHCHNNSKIFLLVDADPDGYTSASIFYNYIKNKFPYIQIQYYLHDGKEHGIESLEMIPTDCNLIVIPDAGSNQKEELEAIAARGQSVLILDHHESDIELNNEQIVRINNQLSLGYPNKALAGAGVVFKFIQAFDTTYGEGQYWQKYYDLATLGCISDVMYSGTLENNSIFYKGLNNIHNKFFKALLNKQSFSITSTINPNKIDIAFYITPVINGVIRFGSAEEKNQMFKAMANNDINEKVEFTSRGEFKVEDYYDHVARICVNTKQRQDGAIERATKKIFEEIERSGAQNNQIIIYKTSLNDKNDIPKTLTGLIAMKICAKYNRCALVLRPQIVDGIQYYMGSGRGKKAEGFESFKDFLNESGLVESAEGHAMAFGATIKEENIEKLIEYANLILRDTDFGSDVIEVCGVNPPMQALEEFANGIRLYGNGMPQPTFAFKGLLHKDKCQIMGSHKDTIKFQMGGYNFIKFHAKDFIERLSENSNPEMIVIIGKAKNNIWLGTVTTQITIDNFEFQKFSLI